MQGFKYLLLLTMLVISQSIFAAQPVFGTAAETKYARDLTPPKGKALIYIYQRKQDGTVPTPTIWLNNYKIGRIVPGSFTVWQLAPGRLGLKVGSTEPATFSVLSQAGKVYLFRLTQLQSGVGPKAQIESLPESYRGDLAETQLIKNPRAITAVAVQPPPQTQSTEKVAEGATKATTTPVHHRASMTNRPGGMGLMLKIGSLSLSNQTQTVLGTNLNFDKSASGPFGVEGYFESSSGLALGGELLGYKAHFTASGGTLSGDAAVLVALANARQYFRTYTNFQPYIGVGVGAALTKITGSIITGNTAGFAYQLVGGVEYRLDNMGFFAEAKYLGAKTKDSNSQTIDVTGTGFYAGVAFHL